MKTAMQEFLEDLKKQFNEQINPIRIDGDYYLEKEKEQIMNDYDKGSDVNDDLKPLYGTPEEYYNQTYNQ